MAYGIKYYYTFKDLTNVNTYTVNILEQSYTGTSTLILGGNDEFIVEYKTVKKLENIRYNGAVLNIISKTNMQFYNLLTNNIKKYKVQLLKNGVITWCGFLNTENYSEDYSKSFNYNVEFTANDGLKVLERTPFLQSNGTNYTGLDTIFNILKKILSKINELDYTYINIGLSTTIQTISGLIKNTTTESLFHWLYLNQENFYDEDNKPMNCKQVLEEILKPFAAQLVFYNNMCYIYDLNAYQSGSIEYKKYDFQTGVYNNTIYDNCLTGDISTIDVYINKQSFENEAGFNRQIITYSQYANNNILDYSCKDTEFSNLYNADSFYTNTDYSYYVQNYSTSNYWDSLSGSCKFCYKKANGAKNANKNESYLKIPQLEINRVNNYGGAFKLKTNLQTLTNSSKNQLRITMKAELCTRDYESETPNKYPYSMDIPILIKVGNKVLKADNTWVTWNSSFGTDNLIYLWFNNVNFSGVISDKALTNNDGINTMNDGIIYNLINAPAGAIEIYICKSIYVYHTPDFVQVNQNKFIKITDFKIEIIDNAKNTINPTDLIYTGILDPNFVNEGDEITLKVGTNVNQVVTSKAALKYYDSFQYQYPNMSNQFVRNGVYNYIENLLLRTIMSNYTYNTKHINTELNMCNMMGYFTHVNYQGGSKFFPFGSKINYRNNSIQLDLFEFWNDWQIIN